MGIVVRWGLVALILAGCGDRTPLGDPDLHLELSLDPARPSVGSALVRVDVSDADWSPRNGARVMITGTREGVPPVVDTARGEGAGRYLAPSFPFTAAGTWILIARVELPDGRWAEVQRRIAVTDGG